MTSAAVDRHYEFTGETQNYGEGLVPAGREIILHRIRATRDLPQHGVKAGDKGGWVQSYEHLLGEAWVADEAQVHGGGRVSGRARLSDHAFVSGNAQVTGDAQIREMAWIFGDAVVSGRAEVSGVAWVYGQAKVSGDEQVSEGTRFLADHC